MVASSCSANEQTEVVRGSVVTREKGWEKEEGADLLGSVGFDRDAHRCGGFLTKNFVAPMFSLAWGKGETGEEEEAV
jgi:hypothetical protein